MERIEPMGTMIPTSLYSFLEYSNPLPILIHVPDVLGETNILHWGTGCLRLAQRN